MKLFFVLLIGLSAFACSGYVTLSLVEGSPWDVALAIMNGHRPHHTEARDDAGSVISFVVASATELRHWASMSRGPHVEHQVSMSGRAAKAGKASQRGKGDVSEGKGAELPNGGDVAGKAAKPVEADAAGARETPQTQTKLGTGPAESFEPPVYDVIPEPADLFVGPPQSGPSSRETEQINAKKVADYLTSAGVTLAAFDAYFHQNIPHGLKPGSPAYFSALAGVVDSIKDLGVSPLCRGVPKKVVGKVNVESRCLLVNIMPASVRVGTGPSSNDGPTAAPPIQGEATKVAAQPIRCLLETSIQEGGILKFTVTMPRGERPDPRSAPTLRPGELPPASLDAGAAETALEVAATEAPFLPHCSISIVGTALEGVSTSAETVLAAVELYSENDEGSAGR